MDFDMMLIAQGIFIWAVVLTVVIDKLPRMPLKVSIVVVSFFTALGVVEILFGFTGLFLLTATLAGIAWGDLLHYYIKDRNDKIAKGIVGDMNDDTI